MAVTGEPRGSSGSLNAPPSMFNPSSVLSMSRVAFLRLPSGASEVAAQLSSESPAQCAPRKLLFSSPGRESLRHLHNEMTLGHSMMFTKE